MSRFFFYKILSPDGELIGGVLMGSNIDLPTSEEELEKAFQLIVQHLEKESDDRRWRPSLN